MWGSIVGHLIFGKTHVYTHAISPGRHNCTDQTDTKTLAHAGPSRQFVCLLLGSTLSPNHPCERVEDDC